MKQPNFTISILVNQTPDEAYNAINNVRGWWSENISGPTDRLNGEFLYSYKDAHRAKMKVVELVPGKKVVWDVLDNYFNFTQDKNEWTGNRIIFDIAEKGNKTEVRFTQQGLTPQYECYEVCNEAWSQYIQESLSNLMSTGHGQPNHKEESQAPAIN